jgi:signal transduction histidine kinase
MANVDPPLTVLLIEDNPNDALLIRRHLEGADTAFLPDDIELHHEESLDAGIQRLDHDGIDLLLLDLGLPETEGAETFDAVREHVESVPVVVLTNLDDEETAVDLLKQGAQDYLSKGALDERQLVKSVRYALERQEQKQRLQTTSQQLEVLNRILRHDIQNDVQVLQMWGERLKEDVAEEHSDDMQKLLETSDHIRELTQNSKEYMQAVTDESEPDTEPVRIDRLLRDELQKARSTYGNATFDVEEKLSATTVSANSMLSSVFRNLLSNAVQHNRTGDPCITVSLESRLDTVRVTVADDGPGVPDDRKKEIFGKGEYGLDSSGTGIGLYLVYTLVTRFDGDAWVEDHEATGGAAFVVELPAAESESWAE